MIAIDIAHDRWIIEPQPRMQHMGYGHVEIIISASYAKIFARIAIWYWLFPIYPFWIQFLLSPA